MLSAWALSLLVPAASAMMSTASGAPDEGKPRVRVTLVSDVTQGHGPPRRAASDGARGARLLEEPGRGRAPDLGWYGCAARPVGDLTAPGAGVRGRVHPRLGSSSPACRASVHGRQTPRAWRSSMPLRRAPPDRQMLRVCRSRRAGPRRSSPVSGSRACWRWSEPIVPRAARWHRRVRRIEVVARPRPPGPPVRRGTARPGKPTAPGRGGAESG